MPVQTISLFDTVTDSADAPVANATVTLTFGYNSATTADGLLQPSIKTVQTDGTGKFTFAKVIPNDLISPANTVFMIETPFRVYEVAPQSGNGASQQSTAANVIVNNPLALAPYTLIGPVSVTGTLAVTGALTVVSNTGMQVDALGNISGRSLSLSSTGPYTPPAGILPGEEVTLVNPYNVKGYGATGNGQTVADGVMNGTTGVLTSASGKFVAGDVGKAIVVFGAGAAGLQLATTIASFQSTTQVTLTAVSATAVGAAIVYWGTSDDAAIRAAAAVVPASGGTIKVPRGIYMCTNNSSCINLPSNCTLQGEGRGSILVWAGTTAQPTIINNTNQSFNATRNGNVKITVRDLAIVGQAGTQLSVAGAVIYMFYVTGICISNVYINGINANSIWVNRCVDATVTENEVQQGAGGIWCTESDSWIMANNRVYNTTDDAIATYGGDGAQAFDSTNGVIAGNVIHDNAGVNGAITVDIASVVTSAGKGSFRVAVVGNTINTSSSYGIIVGGNAVDVPIIGNVIRSSALNGIWVSDRKLGTGGPYSPKRISIHDNVLDGCGNVAQINGAIVVDCYTTAPMVGASIRGNKIYNSLSAGILIHAYGASQSVACVMRKLSITDNFIQDTGSGAAAGIYIYADGTSTIIEHLLIAGNQFWDSGVATQTYAIFFNFSGAATAGIIRQITVMDNDFVAGYVTAAINIAAPANGGGLDLTTTVFSGNKGYGGLQVAAAAGIDTNAAGQLVLGGTNATSLLMGPQALFFASGAAQFFLASTGSLDIRNNANTQSRFRVYDDGRLQTTSTVPTVGSGGAGTSALSIIAGSTNIGGQFQVTTTGVVAGAVLGVVAFGGGALLSAPKVVLVSLSAPTAGVAAPLIAGSDTYSTSGFTIRSLNAPTNATYIVTWIALF